jgi:hypothetical protein
MTKPKDQTENEPIEDEAAAPEPDAAAPAAPPQTGLTRLPSHVAREMERAEERKRRLGSSGPASEVRRIDPKDYQPAPSNKPVRPFKPRKPSY